MSNTNHKTERRDRGEAKEKARPPAEVKLSGAFRGKKDVAEVLKSPDCMRSVRDIAAALEAAKGTPEFERMLSAAEKRIGSATADKKGAIALVRLAGETGNSSRERIARMVEIAHSKLSKNGEANRKQKAVYRALRHVMTESPDGLEELAEKIRPPIKVKLGGVFGEKVDVKDLLENPQTMKRMESARDVVKVLKATKGTGLFGTALAAARVRTKEVESDSRSVVELIRLAMETTNSNRKNVLEVMGAAYRNLSDDGKISKKQKAVDRVLRYVVGETTRGLMIDSHTITSKPSDELVYVLARAVEETGKAKFGGKSPEREEDVDLEMMNMLLSAVFAEWVVDEGESPTLSAKARLACAKALWENGEFGINYWERMVTSYDRNLALYATGCMLSVTDGRELLEDLITERLDDSSAGQIKIATNIASLIHTSADAHDFVVKNLDSPETKRIMLKGLLSNVETIMMKIDGEIVEKVEGLLDYEECKKDALSTLKGAPRPTEESRVYRMALEGDLDAVEFIFERAPEKMRDVLSEEHGTYRKALEGSTLAASYIESHTPEKLADILGEEHGIYREAVEEANLAAIDFYKKDDAALAAIFGDEGRAFEFAAEGNNTYITTLVAMMPDRVKAALNKMYEDKAIVMVKATADEIRREDPKVDPGSGMKRKYGWVVRAKELLSSNKRSVRVQAQEFLLELGKNDSWRIAAKNIPIATIRGRLDVIEARLLQADDHERAQKMSFPHFMRWALAPNREVAVRERALDYLYSVGEIDTAVYEKVMLEAGRVNVPEKKRGKITPASEKSLKLALKIIGKRKLLEDKHLPKLLRVVKNDYHGMAIDAIITITECGKVVPPRLVKERVMAIDLEKESMQTTKDVADMAQMLPHVAPSLGEDAEVMERLHEFGKIAPEQSTYAIARYAKEGSELAKKRVTELLEDAFYILYKKEEVTVEEMGAVGRIIFVIHAQGLEEGTEALREEFIPEMRILATSPKADNVVQAFARGALLELLPEIAAMAKEGEGEHAEVAQDTIETLMPIMVKAMPQMPPQLREIAKELLKMRDSGTDAEVDADNPEEETSGGMRVGIGGHYQLSMHRQPEEAETDPKLSDGPSLVEDIQKGTEGDGAEAPENHSD